MLVYAVTLGLCALIFSIAIIKLYESAPREYFTARRIAKIYGLKNCVILQGCFIQEGLKTLEIDAIIITPGAIYVLEHKKLYGTVSISLDSPFEQTTGWFKPKRLVRSPVLQNSPKVSLIRKLVKRRLPVVNLVYLDSNRLTPSELSDSIKNIHIGSGSRFIKNLLSKYPPRDYYNKAELLQLIKLGTKTGLFYRLKHIFILKFKPKTYKL